MELFLLLSPANEPEIHAIGSQTLIDVITLTYQIPVFDPTNPTEPPKATNPGGNNLLVMEMKTYKSLEQLFGYMLDRTKPGSSSSLISGISVLMELIRRYCR